MRDHQARSTQCCRVLLLVAGMLYVLAGAVEPLVHAWTGQAPVAQWVDGTVSGESSGGTSAPHPHDDSQCLLCKVTAPVVLGLADSTPAPVFARPLPAALQSDMVRAPPAYLKPHPRGPPLAV
jgi:hypothetical protein